MKWSVLSMLVAGARASETGMGCTALAIDSAASTDGSAFAGMNADCADCDIRLTYVPARDHDEATRSVFTFPLKYPVWVGYGRGEMYHPLEGQELSKPVGSIKEVKRTYGYYSAALPLINEKGLGFGESSCSAFLQNRFPDDEKDTRDVPTGFLDTATLMQVALERCDTARCAVKLMGDLVEEYGFLPTPGEPVVGAVDGRVAYDDAGEAYTIADAKGEAWVFHVTGGVKDIVKSVWAAKKVPKGHAAFIANEFILDVLPPQPTDDYMFPTAIFRAAKEANLWDGQSPLHFSKIFAPNPTRFMAPDGNAPIPLYASLRRYGLHHFVAPSQTKEFFMDNTEFPFSVKVEKPVSHRDVMAMFKYHYQGTEFDMAQGALAGPFKTPFRIEGAPELGTTPRGISLQRTLYSIIIHSGPDRQLGWFAPDTPATSIYMPLYRATDAVAPTLSRGTNRDFNRSAAWWAFDFVNNWMQLNYQGMSQEDVMPAIEAWQDTIDQEREKMEHAEPEALGKWQTSLHERVVADWWKMADTLVVKWNDGKHNMPKTGVNYGYPKEWAEMVGFNNDIHPLWVQPVAEPIQTCEGYVASTVTLPHAWDVASNSWISGPTEELSALATSSRSFISPAQTLIAALFFAMGVAVGRRRRPATPQEEPLLSA